MPRVRPALRHDGIAQGPSQVAHWRVGLSLPSLRPSFRTARPTAGSYPTIARAYQHQSQVDDHHHHHCGLSSIADCWPRQQEEKSPLDIGWSSCPSRPLMSVNTRNRNREPGGAVLLFFFQQRKKINHVDRLGTKSCREVGGTCPIQMSVAD